MTSLAAHDLRLVVEVVLLLCGALGGVALGALLLLAGGVEEDDARDQADDETDPAQHETGAVGTEMHVNYPVYMSTKIRRIYVTFGLTSV